MTYRKTLALAIIVLVGTITYDAWYILYGQPQAYIPGLYEIVLLLFMFGGRKAKAYGL